MKKKMLSLLLAAAMCVGALAGCGQSQTQEDTGEQTADAPQPAAETDAGETDGVDADLAAELNIWSSGEELQRFVEGFNQIYPNIKVNITVIPNTEFLSKLTPVISSGQDVPDIFTGESDYVRYLVNAGVWDDLSQAPYSASEALEDVWDYVKDVGTDDTGAIRALSWQTTPGSVIYRRDLAEEVLGVSEPEDVAAYLSDYDKMLETAAVMKEAGITMFGSWEDVMLMALSYRDQPWVVDGKLVIDPKMEDFLDIVKTIQENGYDLNVSEWDPEWIAGVEGDSVFCYILPTWGYSFVIKANAVNTMGKWGLCEGPNPYINGGTWLGIYKDSPNKEAAWAFLEYVTLNSEALQEYASEYGEYVDCKSANDKLAQGEGEETLAGQNIYEFYNQVMSEKPHVTITEYDGQINSAFKTAAKAYATGKLSKEEAIEQFKNDVATNYPELIIE
ncbi:MAG: ABC transporter substrate-binding protein [Eubacteriales bacterium]|nr:ABC transporter substrate-binding protein [Eubacteriales bacterium]